VAPPRAGHRPSPGLVTLTSDVGWAYAAQMKGALLRQAPAIPLVDLTHDLPRHRVAEAAFVLRAMGSSFPPGTIHVAVIDPGVGGARAPLAIRCADGSTLVGPDNGVLAPLGRALGAPRAFRLDSRTFRPGERVGTTFDGRDLFAPAAARLARGEPPARLGSPTSFFDLQLPEPTRNGTDAAAGEVVHVDHFGNLILNLPTPWIPEGTERVQVRVGSRRSVAVPWVRSYESLGPGRLGALGSSFGTAEIAVAEGSAFERFRAPSGTPVEFRWGRGGTAATVTVNTTARLRPRRR
jgi:S-adenosyl-L-methionine hydrolase (adenosine-forming)